MCLPGLTLPAELDTKDLLKQHLYKSDSDLGFLYTHHC